MVDQRVTTDDELKYFAKQFGNYRHALVFLIDYVETKERMHRTHLQQIYGPLKNMVQLTDKQWDGLHELTYIERIHEEIIKERCRKRKNETDG
jgi:hypothetical protein